MVMIHLRSSKIIDEIVKSNLLTPVPESLVEVIMNNLIKQGRIMKIPSFK